MSKESSSYGFATRSIHAGGQPDPATGARQVPIYQSSAYVFPSAQDASDRFNLKSLGPVYSRLTNPTCEALETRLASLEGGVGATVTSSGHAAHILALLPLIAPGEKILVSNKLYGGTTNQFQNTFREHFGWQAEFVDPDNPDDFRRAMSDDVKAIFMEGLSNPGGVVTDIEVVAKIADEYGILLIVDNTIASPYLCRPFEWGAHIVTHSTTKFLCGNGTTMGGAVVDSGRFNWAKYADKYPQITKPNASYNGMVLYDEFGEMAYTVHGHAIGLRDVGSCQAPMNAFLTMVGIETLPLRMRQHVANAQKVAEFLDNHDRVTWVSYAGLPDSRYYSLAQKYTPEGPGAVFSFGIRGGMDEAMRFLDALELFSFLANIGDTRSLIIHPASTTHSQLTPEHRKSIGVGDDTMRVSIGIEDANDIISDLDNALMAMTERCGGNTGALKGRA